MRTQSVSCESLLGEKLKMSWLTQTSLQTNLVLMKWHDTLIYWDFQFFTSIGSFGKTRHWHMYIYITGNFNSVYIAQDDVMLF